MVSEDRAFSSRYLLTWSRNLAAPLVAGVIANYLAYDKAPFDQADGKLAGSVRDYLAKTANWERKAGTKVIWNEVTGKPSPPFEDCLLVSSPPTSEVPR